MYDKFSERRAADTNVNIQNLKEPKCGLLWLVSSFKTPNLVFL